jgi:hypothetical protein
MSPRSSILRTGEHAPPQRDAPPEDEINLEDVLSKLPSQAPESAASNERPSVDPEPKGAEGASSQLAEDRSKLAQTPFQAANLSQPEGWDKPSKKVDRVKPPNAVSVETAGRRRPALKVPNLLPAVVFLMQKVVRPTASYIWGYLKKAGRFIGDHTTFGQERKPPTWNRPRRWIYGLTGGRWNFGRSAEEKRITNVAAIRSIDSTEPDVIATNSKAAGGVGKTTTAVAVAQALAADLPNISVALVEINPQGSVKDATGVRREDIACVKLAQKEPDPIKKQLLKDEACFTVLEAIANLHKLQSMQDVRFRFAQMPGTGVFVLTHPEATRIDPRDLRRFVAAMRRIFPKSVWDLDQYDSHSDTATMLELADVVLVPATRRNKARIRQAGEALWDLQTTYHTRSVLVINRVWFNWFHRSTTRNVRKIQELRESENHRPYCGPVGTLPWNFRVALGGRFLLRSRSGWFKRHVRELTALACEEARKAHLDQSNTSVHEPAPVGSGPAL